MKNFVFSILLTPFIFACVAEARTISCQNRSAKDSVYAIQSLKIDLNHLNSGMISIKRFNEKVNQREVVLVSARHYFWYEGKVIVDEADRYETESVSLVSRVGTTRKNDWFLIRENEVISGPRGCIPEEDHPCLFESSVLQEVPVDCIESN